MRAHSVGQGRGSQGGSTWATWAAIAPKVAEDPEDIERRRLEIVESYKVVCICNKIRRGAIQKAIAGGATTLDEVRRRTRAATGPCGAKRCGPVIAGMLRGR